MWSKEEQENFVKLLTEFRPELSEKQKNLLLEYALFVLTENKKINLTAIDKADEFAVKHIIDSLMALDYVNAKRIIDIGSGAGMPGLIWALANQNQEYVLLDSLAKRVRFLEQAIQKLQLKEVKAIHLRAEDAAKSPLFREKYQLAVARAVAKLPVLLEYCLPFVTVGGRFMALKGLDIEEEISLSKNALEVLGGEVEEIINYKLPLNMGNRSLVIIKKVINSPDKFPRKAGTPAKFPL